MDNLWNECVGVCVFLRKNNLLAHSPTFFFLISLDLEWLAQFPLWLHKGHFFKVELRWRTGERGALNCADYILFSSLFKCNVLL